MPKFNDLTGKIFGELTVIDKADYYIDGKGRKYVVWNCLCSCGAHIKIQSRKLIKGHITHCGCKNINLVGQKINAWTVLKKDTNGFWICQCQCGTTRKISTNNLLEGRSKSCGCSSWFNLIGKKIGRLEIIEYAYTKNNHTYVKCKCDCGNEKIIKTSDLNKKHNPTQSCGCISKERCEKVKLEGTANLSGEIFGKWTVLKYNGNGKWLCQCECGNESLIASGTLTCGQSTSCGKCYENMIDSNFFDNITTEEKAYILGLLYADGYNNESKRLIRLDLQEDDLDILLKIKDIMQFQGEIKFYQNEDKIFKISGSDKEYKCKPTARLLIHNTRISEQLALKGCTNNKTYNIKFPDDNILPIYLHRHFIRGLIDGDGSITYWIDNKKTGHKKFTLTLTGTTEIVNSVNDIITSKFDCKPDLRNRYKERNNNNLTLAICGNRVIENILDWIYYDSNIYLDRKYEKYLVLKEQNKITSYNQTNTYCMKKIIQADLDNNLIKEFKSISETKKDGFCPSSVLLGCKGKYKDGSHQHKNYLWYYKTDYELLAGKEVI